MIKFIESENLSLDIYKNKEIESYLNNYNILTTKQIDKIEKNIKKGYFKVPYVLINQAWGIEKVFIPFSNKLFKVLKNDISNTSVQFHPLKSEKYISLSDNTVVYDEEKEYKIKKYQCVDIQRNTIHSMKKGSKIFEEQDNVLFDKSETMRIYDLLGRKINSPQEYYKYLLPQFKNKMIIQEDIPNNEYEEGKDKFIFLIDGTINIKINNEIVTLNGNEDLYYFDKNIKIEKIIGKYKIINCIFYKVVNYEK